MEIYMQKFLQVLNPASKNLPVPKVKIEQTELFDMQELLLDFTNLVSYENNRALQNRRILQDAVENAMFLNAVYVEGTQQYESLLSQYRELKTLEDGQSISKKDVSIANVCHNELFTVLKKDGKFIRRYTQIMPFYNAEAQYYPSYAYKNALSSPDVEVDDGVIYLDDPSGEKTSCFLENDQLVVVGYDIRRNPFSKKHFRIFDEHGEIKDISDMDYIKLARKIRDAEAHHKVYTYFNGKPYGGKVVPLGNGKAALFSSRWHEFLMRTSLLPASKKTSEFTMICVPHSNQSIRTDEACIDKINSIRIIKIRTKEPINSTYAYAWLDKIVQNYENTPTKTKTLKEFIEAQASKWLGECTCVVSPLENPHLLKNRLVGDTGFYNVFEKEKDNAEIQEMFIKHLIEHVYDKSYITAQSMSANGKIKPVHVDIQDLCLFLNAELPRLHNLAGVVKGSKYIKNTAVYASIEKQIALPLMCAYKNLIRNHFVDEMLDYANYPAGFALSGKHAEYKRMLSVLDMKMFEIYKNNHKGDPQPATTFEQKVNVLRVLRNAISHNQVSVQFNKNCDINESKFVFDIGDYSKVRVNVVKFFEFINQPLFADYQSLDRYTIKASNTEELKTFIRTICKNERMYGRDNEWVGE